MSDLPLVLQLQRDALNSSVRVSDLLRKAKVAAVKLGIEEMAEWVEQEFNGYEKEVPPYRVLHGKPVLIDAYGASSSLNGRDSAEYMRLSTRDIGCGIEKIVAFLENKCDLFCRFSQEFIADMHAIYGDNCYDGGTVIGQEMLCSVISSVRNVILDWSLKLEAAGILGEGFTFTPKEKELAKEPSIQHITINGDNAVVGTTGAAVTVNHVHGLDMARVAETLREIESLLPAMRLTRDSEAEANDILERATAEIGKSRPDTGTVRSLLGSLKTIAEGAAGGIASSGVVTAIAALVG